LTGDGGEGVSVLAARGEGGEDAYRCGRGEADTGKGEGCTRVAGATQWGLDLDRARVSRGGWRQSRGQRGSCAE
jgi:hypothetical protein